MQNYKDNIILFQSILAFVSIDWFMPVDWFHGLSLHLLYCSGEMIQTAKVYHGQKLVLVQKHLQFQNLILSIDM